MKLHPLYPMTFRPVYKDYGWGGTTIAARYNRGNTPATCAESWELSGEPGESSVIANGAFEGESLDRLVKAFGRDLLGSKATAVESFPLRVKLMDVHRALQVDPAEAAAHEAWYLLKTPDEAPECLGLPAHQGDLFNLPAGVQRSAGAGNFIYSVRHLLPEPGVEPSEPLMQPLSTTAPAHRELQRHLTTEHFTFATLRFNRSRSLHTTEQSFMILFCTEGKTTLDHEGSHPLTLFPGDLVLLPPKQRVFLHPFAPTHLLVTTL